MFGQLLKTRITHVPSCAYQSALLRAPPMVRVRDPRQVMDLSSTRGNTKKSTLDHKFKALLLDINILLLA